MNRGKGDGRIRLRTDANHYKKFQACNQATNTPSIYVSHACYYPVYQRSHS
jgi:hypothetical protein